MNTLKFERQTDAAGHESIGVLTINRPDKLNALNQEVLRELSELLSELASDTKLRAIVMTGAGDKAFVAGADIQAMSKMTPAEAYRFASFGHKTMRMLEEARYAVIGAVNGFALGGGCELALACDFLYASDKAKFGQPEVNLGAIPGLGGSQRLTRRVGIGQARELCMTAAILDANEALRIGLVNKVVPHAELLGKALETAKLIASKGPLAVAAAKRMVTAGADVPLSVANEMEAQAFASLFGSHDQREGMGAFLEKRAAVFDGT